MAVSFRPEDQAFVQIAIDECKALNLTKHSPNALTWNSKLPVDQPALYRGYLMMPEALNTRILPQEARPLIMSAILQKELVKRRNPLDEYAGVFVLIGTLMLIVPILIIVPGKLPASIGAPVFLVWILYMLVGPSLLRLRNNRLQRLDSDLRVAQFIGSDVFSQTLRKIENLNLSSQRSRIRIWLSGWPSLSQRIANLNNPSLPTTEKDAFKGFQTKWGLNPNP